MINLDKSRAAAHARELLRSFDAQNPKSALHGDRVAALAVRIARHMGLERNALAAVRVAAELHDLGKLELPRELLEKAESLSRDEWELMNRHPALGEQILLRTGNPRLRKIASYIRHHHEFFGGRGYPDGLEEEQIPLVSRIIAVADAYEGMAAERAYRDVSPHKRILEVMAAEVGIKWDPAVFRALIAVLAKNQPTPAWWTVPTQAAADRAHAERP